jgi:hypothetical protein
MFGDLANIDADLAWDRLMPLRAKRAVRLQTPDDVRITLEGYAFPHSVGVLGMVFIEPPAPLPLSDMVDRAIQARLTQYSVTWEGPPPKQDHGSLDSLADKLIDLMHQELLGQTPHGKPLSEPITTATFIDASWSNETEQDGDDLDDALEALCNFTRQTTGNHRIHAGPTTYRVLPIERGRAVWDPTHFSPDPTRPRVRALGCYHRNLALASLQARSLTGLLRRAEDFLPAEPVSSLLIRPARNAVKLLSAMLSGADTTYQTWALADQIRHYEDLMNKVYAAIGT